MSIVADLKRERERERERASAQAPSRMLSNEMK